MGRRPGDQAVRLKGLMTIRKGGRVYRYLRRPGQPLLRLPDLPADHPDFLAAYAAAQAAPTPRKERHKPGSIGALLEAVIASERFLACRAGYRDLLRRHFDAIREGFGALPAAGLRDRHIKADVFRAKDPTARHKAWRFACAWAVDASLLPADPSHGLAAPERVATEGHPPWTAEEIGAYRARWPVGTVARAVMELLHWTGARISDAVLIGPQHVDRDGVLTFRQSKTGDPAHVPWTCPLPPYAHGMEPDRDMMHAALAPLAGQMTFLATGRGRTRSAKALGVLVGKMAAEAGIEKSAHGLRKARAVALAEAGATTHQLAAWTGHRSLKEVEHYTLAASRRRAVMGEFANQPDQNCKPSAKAHEIRASEK